MRSLPDVAVFPVDFVAGGLVRVDFVPAGFVPVDLVGVGAVAGFDGSAVPDGGGVGTVAELGERAGGLSAIWMRMQRRC